MIQRPKGTKDVLPKDAGTWQYIEDISNVEQLQALRGAIESGQISIQDVDHTEDAQKVL